MSWEIECRECKTSTEYFNFCKQCWACFDCVDQCADHFCIDCYVDDPITKMKAIWERRRKPYIEYLMSTKSGHYMAIESICHSCEHAYKAIKKAIDGAEVTGDVMQHALEAVLRVQDFSCAEFSGHQYQACERPYWGRPLAREIKTLLLNPLKHEGRLPHWISITNNPKHIGFRTVSGHGTNVSPEVEFDPKDWNLGMTEDRQPYWHRDDPTPIQWSDPEIQVTYGAKSLVSQLTLGLDTMYAIFTDPHSSDLQRSWFSPAEQGQFRGNIDTNKALIVEEMKRYQQ